MMRRTCLVSAPMYSCMHNAESAERSNNGLPAAQTILHPAGITITTWTVAPTCAKRWRFNAALIVP